MCLHLKSDSYIRILCSFEKKENCIFKIFTSCQLKEYFTQKFPDPQTI